MDRKISGEYRNFEEPGRPAPTCWRLIAVGIAALYLLCGAASLKSGITNWGNWIVQNNSDDTDIGAQSVSTYARLMLKTACGACYMYKNDQWTIFYSDSGMMIPELWVRTTGDVPGTVHANLDGNVTGNVSGSSGSCTGNAATATLASTTTVADTTDTTCSVALYEDAAGSLGAKTDGGLAYNAFTGVLTAAGFSGPLTGNVTGNCSGTAATVTGATQASITTCANLTTIGTLSHDLNIADTKKYMINNVQSIRYFGTGTAVFGDGGASLGNTTGSEGYYNTFIGKSAGAAATRTYYSTAAGFSALSTCTTGLNNTAYGFSSLRNVETQADNCGFGTNSGRYYAANSSATPAQSTYIGSNTKASGATPSNETALGYAAVAQGNNTIMLGNSAIDSTNGLYCYDTGIASPSDESLKKDIEDFSLGLDFILKLKPKEFRYKTDSDTSDKRQGFVAQDIQTALNGRKWNGLGKCIIDGEEKLAVAPSDLIPVLVNAIQEQQIRIDALEARLDKIEKK